MAQMWRKRKKKQRNLSVIYRVIIFMVVSEQREETDR